LLFLSWDWEAWCLTVWGVIPPLPERNTAWNKGRKCFHCLGAPNNLIRPWDRSLRPNYLRILHTVHWIKSWNRLALKYSRPGYLFWRRLRFRRRNFNVGPVCILGLLMSTVPKLTVLIHMTISMENRSRPCYIHTFPDKGPSLTHHRRIWVLLAMVKVSRTFYPIMPLKML